MLTGVGIPLPTFVEFVASTLAAMIATARRLGDERVNQRPPLAATRTPRQLWTGCTMTNQYCADRPGWRSTSI
jgi:hypothetical protein